MDQENGEAQMSVSGFAAICKVQTGVVEPTVLPRKKKEERKKKRVPNLKLLEIFALPISSRFRANRLDSLDFPEHDAGGKFNKKNGREKRSCPRLADALSLASCITQINLHKQSQAAPIIV